MKRFTRIRRFARICESIRANRAMVMMMVLKANEDANEKVGSFKMMEQVHENAIMDRVQSDPGKKRNFHSSILHMENKSNLDQFFQVQNLDRFWELPQFTLRIAGPSKSLNIFLHEVHVPVRRGSCSPKGVCFSLQRGFEKPSIRTLYSLVRISGFLLIIPALAEFSVHLSEGAKTLRSLRKEKKPRNPH